MSELKPMMAREFWSRPGSIPEAIRLSKQQSKLFLVYVSGKDEVSHRMDECWNNERVMSLCENSCIAVKLQANSDGCKQFSAIYPVLCIPSAYFIDNAGKLVEALVLQSSIEEFVKKVENVTKPYLKEASLPNQATQEHASVISTRTATSAKSVEDKITSEHQKNGPAIADAASQGDDDSNSVSTSGLNSNAPNSALSDKDGKVSEEVSNQLKQYRTAVAKEFEKEATDRERLLQQATLMQKEAKDKEAQEKRSIRQSHSRLQFRLPDGAAIIQTFQSDEAFISAVNYIKRQNLQSLENRSFSLSQVYPRRNFSIADYTKTFQQLDMVPSASLVVIPSNEVEKTPGLNTVNNLLSLLMFVLLLPYKIFLHLWRFIVPQSQPPQNVANASRHGNLATRSPVNRPGISNANVRRRYTHNMARLSDTANDDDDDNATWNGNSTQQM